MIQKILAVSVLLCGSVFGGEEKPVQAVLQPVQPVYTVFGGQQDVYRATLGTRMRWAHQDRMARLAASRVVVPRAVPIMQAVPVTPIVQAVPVTPVVPVIPVQPVMRVWAPCFICP